MESALARQALSAAMPRASRGGRRLAALLLFSALLAGCHRGPRPQVLARLRIGLGADCLSLAPSGGRVAVACRRSNDVWVLGLPKGDVLARLDTLPKPRAVLFHPNGATFYVAEGLSTVAQVRLSDLRVARRFRPRWRITRLAIEPVSGRIYGGHLGVPLLGIYRLKDMHLETSVAVGGEVMAMDFRGSDGYIVTRQADGLLKLALQDLSVKAVAYTGPDPRGLALSPDGGTAWVVCHGRAGEVGALDLPTPVPSPDELSSLSGTALADGDAPADGGDDAAAGAETDTEGVPTDEDDQAPGPGPDQDHQYDGGGVAVLALKDVRRVDFLPVPGGPMALVLGPSGRQVAVACDDGTLRIVDLGTRKVAQELDLGGRPGALVADPDGEDLLLALSDDKVLLRIRPGAGWR